MLKRLPSGTIHYLILGLLLVGLGISLEHRFNVYSQLPVWNGSAVVMPARDVLPSQIGAILNGRPPEDISAKNKNPLDMSTFWQSWKILEDEYYVRDKVDAGKMIDGAIAGMVASLGDPYTAYLPPKQNERSSEELAGSFYGVGIELGFSNDGILSVMAPLDDTPASKAGLQPNDLIINVKDEVKKMNESTSGWSIDKAVDSIRGPKDSTVVLTIVRRPRTEATAATSAATASAQLKPFEVPLQRGEIVVKSVKLDWLEKAGKPVAHIKLNRFGERTVQEWDTVVKEIQQKGPLVAGVILDMRNNPGGLFDDAIYVSSDFMDKGTVVSEKGKLSTHDFASNGSGRLKNYPLLVLINGGSASASEIVAGALKDIRNATLIGEKSFGKGTVQNRLELVNGGGIHVTIAQWLTPKGNWIHQKGIEVDVKAPDNYETKDVDETIQVALQKL